MEEQAAKRQRLSVPVLASSPETETKVMAIEISTIQQRFDLPRWITDAFTLTCELSSSELKSEVEAFAAAIADRQLLNPLTELPAKYQNLRGEQCSYLASDSFGKDEGLTVNGVPKDKWSDILEDQADHPTWRKWLLLALYKGQPYGAVFVFHDPKLDSLWMQGISQLDIPAHYRLSSGNHLCPTLNEMLIPRVEQAARELGCKNVVCRPINGQDQHLVRFGFGSTASETSVCAFSKPTFGLAL
jgi:hypothetical protein